MLELGLGSRAGLHLGPFYSQETHGSVRKHLATPKGRRQLASTMQRPGVLELPQCKAVSTIENYQPLTVNVPSSRALPPSIVALVPNAQLHGLGTLIRLLRTVQPQTLGHSRHGTRPVLDLSSM